MKMGKKAEEKGIAEEHRPKIFGQIPKIMAEIGAHGISKDQTNKHQNFKFRGIDDVYNSLNKIMSKHGIFSTTNVISHTCQPSGKGYIITLEIDFTFYAADGSNVTEKIVTHAIDYGDKGYNKCISIAHKMALLTLFAIPTQGDNDPDAHSPQATPEDDLATAPKTQTRKTTQKAKGKLPPAPREITTDIHRIDEIKGKNCWRIESTAKTLWTNNADVVTFLETAGNAMLQVKLTCDDNTGVIEPGSMSLVEGGEE